MPKEQRSELVERVRAYIFEERNEEIGELAAERMLDFFLELVEPAIYNQALEDARQAVLQRVANLEDDLDLLKKSQRLIARK